MFRRGTIELRKCFGSVSNRGRANERTNERVMGMTGGTEFDKNGSTGEVRWG